MLKVLVVEDNEDIRELLRASLAGPFTVYTAPTEEEAKKCLQSLKIDLVLLDVWLVGHSSISIIPWMVENDLGVQTVLITGDNQIRSDPEFIKIEKYVDDVLIKPFNMSDVVSLAFTALKKKVSKFEEEFRSME